MQLIFCAALTYFFKFSITVSNLSTLLILKYVFFVPQSREVFKEPLPSFKISSIRG